MFFLKTLFTNKLNIFVLIIILTEFLSILLIFKNRTKTILLFYKIINSEFFWVLFLKIINYCFKISYIINNWFLL